MTTARPLFLAALLGLLGTAACSDDGGTVVEIAASDDACVPADTELDAGSTTFRVTNEGKQVTEVYVYAAGDRVVTERENIGPGTSADFSVDLAAGTYEIACKPGQTGDGIRQEIIVTGDGGAAIATEGDIEVVFESVDYTFEGLDTSGVSAGDSVEFEMTNAGDLEHEFEVFGPDGEVLGEIGPTAPGEAGTVVLELDEAGTYRYICGIDDHEQQGMAGTFELS